jgi:hypothetical protein
MNEKTKLEESLSGEFCSHSLYLPASLPLCLSVSLSLSLSAEAKHKISLLQDSLSRLENSNNSLGSSYGQKLQAIRQQLQSTTQMLEQVSQYFLLRVVNSDRFNSRDSNKKRQSATSGSCSPSSSSTTPLMVHL